MRYIKDRKILLLENVDNTLKTNKGSTSVIFDLCVCMLLINPNFLDKLLDVGIKGRYENNSSVFLTDLKNLLLSKNRLKLGIFLEDGTCIEDTEISKVNTIFNQYSPDFSIEEDWNKLISARNLARNIQDKLFIDEKLREEVISSVYWIGLNKTDEHSEDIVIETHDGKQFSININKKINLTKTISFNKIIDTLFDKKEGLYSEDLLPKWNKLTTEWVNLIYTNCKPNIKSHIKKFIDPERIESITYFSYYDIKHSDPKFSILGEFIPELDENILNFSDLLSSIWKNGDKCFDNFTDIESQWNEKKIFMLNSRIVEYFLTSCIKEISNEMPFQKEENSDFIIAVDKFKMKLTKLVLDQIGCQEKDVYYFVSTGNIFYKIPRRQFFRDNFNSIKLLYDIHSDLTIDSTDIDNINSSNFKIKLLLDNELLLQNELSTKFSSGEMSGKLSTKYKIEFVTDFNYQIYKKENPNVE